MRGPCDRVNGCGTFNWRRELAPAADGPDLHRVVYDKGKIFAIMGESKVIDLLYPVRLDREVGLSVGVPNNDGTVLRRKFDANLVRLFGYGRQPSTVGRNNT